MKATQLIMGMPITVEISDTVASAELEAVFDYFRAVDQRYSAYKADSEVSLYNAGKPLAELSGELQFVLDLCSQTKDDTGGFFDITKADGTIDPSGLVKGWAICNAANQLRLKGWDNFYIEAGGDVQVAGKAPDGQDWRLGIRNPFDSNQIVKVLHVSDCGIATSGDYIRGDHIYNPRRNYAAPEHTASLTVIGPNIYDADRFTTAAFAMGEQGMDFIQQLKGFEGYMIDDKGIATYTPGFEKYVA